MLERTPLHIAHMLVCLTCRRLVSKARRRAQARNPGAPLVGKRSIFHIPLNHSRGICHRGFRADIDVARGIGGILQPGRCR